SPCFLPRCAVDSPTSNWPQPCINRAAYGAGVRSRAAADTKALGIDCRRSGRSRVLPLALGHRLSASDRWPSSTAAALQPSASRRRGRHRLPLLPHLRGDLAVCRHSEFGHLHELPLAAVPGSAALSGAASERL